MDLRVDKKVVNVLNSMINNEDITSLVIKARLIANRGGNKDNHPTSIASILFSS